MADRIVISHQQIKEVRQDGIVYVDATGDEQFISFKSCYQNYFERRLSRQSSQKRSKVIRMLYRFVAEWSERRKGWRAVADRNVLGDDFMRGANNPPYFEFYTTPRIRIEFDSREALDTMRYLIERQFRWRTSDLT
jgi:hypothetical protein